MDYMYEQEVHFTRTSYLTKTEGNFFIGNSVQVTFERGAGDFLNKETLIKGNAILSCVTFN